MGRLYPPPPSASLPPLNTIVSLTEAQIMTHIQNLVALYCPLAFGATLDKEKPMSESPVDSGYASETETESNNDGRELRLEALRADAFERKTVERWLTGFMARAETLACFSSDAACQHALDQASWVLESFFAGAADEGQQMGGGITDYTRTFSFDLPPANGAEKKHTIEVRLNDGLAGMNSSEPDDVGLQSWGASIVFSKMICAEPSRFLLDYTILGTAPRVVELGAGTGLVSIALASLLPRIGISHPTVVATDYHPAVLANLRANIEANFLDKGDGPIQSCALDWAVPELKAPLDVPADVLVATDAVYAPEHAALLRDCATLLLASQGVFWLVMTVRPNGKFEAVGGTVEAAFEAADRPKGRDGRQLTVLGSERLEKHQGIGRGDESYYRLYRIGWA
ncbi:hypothetical protein C7999DRAFT_32055 [Corynascus novoguineensis]|uniref:S-adenosylmethionine-dependent methyltransferase n=1 Tax=Corynascus novoguineensis TaxID=1126955 RepID=A0AAN7CSH0_9PEZI|nr:hypothetical protein C7999DRAFT_32055 [Corynascus novoguineensis]